MNTFQPTSDTLCAMSTEFPLVISAFHFLPAYALSTRQKKGIKDKQSLKSTHALMS